MRRTALVTGVGEFEQTGTQGEPAAWHEDPPERLGFVPDRMSRVSAALTSAGFAVHTTQPHPRAATLREHITTTCASSSDAVLIHFVGHGMADEDRRLRILGADVTPGALGRTSLNVAGLIEDLELDDGSPVLMLLDVCQAGVAARTQALAHGTHRRVWVIGAAGYGATAHHGRFSVAVADTVRLLRTGQIDLHPSLPYVPLRTVADLVEQQLHRLCETDGVLPQWLEMTPEFAARDAAPPFFDNPLYSLEQSQLDRALHERSLRTFLTGLDAGFDATHYLTRASGQPHQKLTDRCFFTGRTDELADLARWMDETTVRGHGLRVVTGGPGAGKSALLGMLVCAAHPRLVNYAGSIVSRIDSAHRPSINPGLLAIHARGLSLAEINASVLRQLGRPDTGRNSVEDVFEALAASSAPLLILDALDESVEPRAILNQLLLPLIRTQTCGLLVGLRKWEEFEELFTAARACRGLTDLDTLPEALLRQHLANYVESLMATEGSPYARATHRTLRNEIAANVADALADAHVTGGFLVAGLYAHHLTAQNKPVDVPTARSDVPRSLGQVLELHLSSLTGTDQFLRPMLASLGHAKGEGLPRRLLVHASRAFLPSTMREAPEESDIERALATISFYLRSSMGPNGITVYRFFHQALADHMQEHPSGDGETRDRQVDECRLFGALLNSARPTLEEPVDWRRADPYLLRHAAEHAGPDIDRLLTDPEFLVHADAHHLLPQLGFATSTRGRLASEIYRTSSSLHLTAAAEERRHVLAIDAVRWGDPTASTRLLDGATTTLPWAYDLATASGTRIGYLGSLQGHHGPLRSLRTRVLGEHVTAVTAGADNTVRSWDIDTIQQTGLLKLGATHAEVVNYQDANAALVLHDGRIAAYRLPEMRRLKFELTDPEAPFVEFTVQGAGNDGLVVTRNSAGVLRVYSLKSGRNIRSLTGFPAGTPFAATRLPGGSLRIYVADNASRRISEWDTSTNSATTYVTYAHLQGIAGLAVHHQAWVTALLVSDLNGDSWFHPGRIDHRNWKDAHWVRIEGGSTAPERIHLLRGVEWDKAETKPSPRDFDKPGGPRRAFVAIDDGILLNAVIDRNKATAAPIIQARQKATHFDIARAGDTEALTLALEDGSVHIWQRRETRDFGRRDYLHDSPGSESSSLALLVWRQKKFPENSRDDIISLSNTGEIRVVSWKGTFKFTFPANSEVFNVVPYRSGTTSNPEPVDLWDWELEQEHTLRRNIDTIPEATTLTCARMSEGALLLAGCADGTIRIWHRFVEAESSHAIVNLTDEPIIAMAVLNDGMSDSARIAVASGDRVHIVSLNGPGRRDYKPWFGHKVEKTAKVPGRITHMQPTLTSDGKLIVSVQGGAILSVCPRLLTTTRLLAGVTPEAQTIRTIGQSFALLGADGRVRLGQLSERPREPSVLRSLDATCVDLVLLAGRVQALVGCPDRSLRAFDPGTGEPLTEPLFLPAVPRVLMPLHDDHIAVGFGPDIAILRWNQLGRPQPAQSLEQFIQKGVEQLRSMLRRLGTE